MNKAEKRCLRSSPKITSKSGAGFETEFPGQRRECLSFGVRTLTRI
jgi:hypothetical protein